MTPRLGWALNHPPRKKNLMGRLDLLSNILSCETKNKYFHYFAFNTIDYEVIAGLLHLLCGNFTHIVAKVRASLKYQSLSCQQTGQTSLISYWNIFLHTHWKES